MNWSLMLNALLLIGVVIAIVRTIQTRRQQESQKIVKNRVGTTNPSNNADEIIAVRKVGIDNQTISPMSKPTAAMPLRQPTVTLTQPIQSNFQMHQSATLGKSTVPVAPKASSSPEKDFSVGTESIMIFLLAKSKRQLAGYELLQAVLSAGFRFGESGLFHRHQFPNCQGPVMCSLAAATPTGVFDLQNIGGFVVHGLCLFMHMSGQRDVDAERFDVMLDTARTLSDSLDTHLLDELREPFSEQSMGRYHQRLMLNEEQVCVD